MTDAPYLGDGPAGGFARWLTASDGVRIRAVLWPCDGARGTVAGGGAGAGGVKAFFRGAERPREAEGAAAGGTGGGAAPAAGGGGATAEQAGETEEVQG